MDDVKELVGTIMRALDNADITEAEVLDLSFEAEDETLDATTPISSFWNSYTIATCALQTPTWTSRNVSVWRIR